MLESADYHLIIQKKHVLIYQIYKPYDMVCDVLIFGLKIWVQNLTRTMQLL